MILWTMHHTLHTAQCNVVIFIQWVFVLTGRYLVYRMSWRVVLAPCRYSGRLVTTTTCPDNTIGPQLIVGDQSEVGATSAV